MLEVVTVVVVSEEGNGGGCFVSSCGWFDMFFENYRDATWFIFAEFIIVELLCRDPEMMS